MCCAADVVRQPVSDELAGAFVFEVEREGERREGVWRVGPERGVTCGCEFGAVLEFCEGSLSTGDQAAGAAGKRRHGRGRHAGSHRGLHRCALAYCGPDRRSQERGSDPQLVVGIGCFVCSGRDTEASSGREPGRSDE